jgi:Asp-tRNA(Asn)/Glu-tRNA(Gln) amidotransferase A subunit family amidase
VNPAAPNRVPGGSSSGSGVAVAADLVDFSLGGCMVESAIEVHDCLV